MPRQVFSGILASIDSRRIVIGLVVWREVDGSRGRDVLKLRLLVCNLLGSGYAVDVYHFGAVVRVWRVKDAQEMPVNASWREQDKVRETRKNRAEELSCTVISLIATPPCWACILIWPAHASHRFTGASNKQPGSLGQSLTDWTRIERLPGPGNA